MGDLQFDSEIVSVVVSDTESLWATRANGKTDHLFLRRTQANGAALSVLSYSCRIVRD